MKQRTPVSAIMTKNIIGLKKSDDLQYAETLFNKHKIKHIPVVSGKAVIGMLSYSDLLKISYADVTEDESDVDAVVYNMFTIEQVMVKNVVTISSETTIKEATRRLAESDFHALPVVDNGILKGIITTTDLLNYFVDQF
ncbi:CBS domain-containing protein [Algibacter aquimarinus]|uniref:CBS domain-containing protein n=1 Tax=Algibacter aquimarinus TaxID=1136748 RepID=A0ABP9H8E5_9FLAO